MNVVEINNFVFGSGSTIMLGLSEYLKKEGHHVLVCYPANRTNLRKKVAGSYLIRTRIERKISTILSQWFGCDDLLFRLPTWRLIRKMERFHVDLVHLHCLHDWYINIPMLFRYLRRKQIPVVWTLHDCWPLTGNCTFFVWVGCEKWKSTCQGCPIYRSYPQCRIDNAARLLAVKRKYVAGTPKLTLAAPSEWMASIARQSYLKDSPVRVVYNGIDTSVFCPTESDFRKRQGLEGKIILLGVANPWRIGKGPDVFVQLANELEERFAIVLVGTDDEVDKSLPDRIVSIHRTYDRKELASIYTAADLFVNPTRQEVFGLVNVEALACGTPVLTFNSGGSPETIDPTCGSVVEKDDYEALKAEIYRITQDRPYSSEACRTRALQLSEAKMHETYSSLFRELVGKDRS